MEKDYALLLLCMLLAMAAPAMAGSITEPGTCSVQTVCNISQTAQNLTVIQSNSTICIYFFYGSGCPHCANIEPFITEMEGKYPVQVKAFEIYYNESNKAMFDDFSQRYGIGSAGIPAVFIGDRALVGENSIRDNLEADIQYFLDHPPICPEDYKKVIGNAHDVSPIQNLDLTLTSVIAAALIDSINPCAFAVMIFLLLYLTSLGSRRRVLLVGIFYIASVFVTYFLSGLGIFAVIQTAGLTRIIYTLAAVLAIIAGLVNLKDFFFFGRGISLSIPESRKGTISRYVRQASIPSAVILGFLVSLFELPCTGGIYLAILGLLGSKMTLMQGIPYLLLYNFIFVLPLFVILAVIYRGVTPERAEQWRKGKRKWMRLAMGLLMVLLGSLMLLGMI